MSRNMPGSARSHQYSMPSMASGRSTARTAQGPSYEYSMTKSLRFFDPCAATASMFLYAQGPSVVCCHHDTLTIERRFSRHTEDILLLAVDNQSEIGAGRFVVSYDAAHVAIVWDLMTGDEIARTTPKHDVLTVATWMKNGNVAFGNARGHLIQFEPTTVSNIAERTIDQIPITALAPSNDCRTFAIGYQNGTLLVATLQPRFTILHNLSTARGPSPIVTLSWHASSSRQKSDMLAVQTHDGDLRVWSVAKSHNAEDPAKIVRVLKRTENYRNGPNWMGWSKNGRIIQFNESETLSWDVRTKHVTFDSIPTLDHVRGLAVYGPGATLFTLGPNNTIQQFDLNSPAIMVANVQHPAALLPPSPPVSLEESTNQSVHSVTTINTSESESSVPFDMIVSESDDDHMGPFARLARQQQAHGHQHGMGNDMYDLGSELSSRSGLSGVSRPSASGSRTPGLYPASTVASRQTENTYISTGTSLKSSTIGKQQQRDMDAYSMGYTIGTSAPSIPSTQSRKPTRRKDTPQPQPPSQSQTNPEDSKVRDLFPFTRSRLSDIPYKRPMASNYGRLTNDDLRRQMLSTIFGWNKEVDDLIRDEMSRHPHSSPGRILLGKWLGDIDADFMATSTENMTSSDWMLLALSGIGGQASQHKLGHAYVQRLLESGDIHAAVTIMLGMGDQNDAVEIYISHRKYMEALILCSLVFPSVWERQCAILNKWGEWAVQHGQQQLAIRCFSCTDQESTEPWASPSATQLSFGNISSISEVLNPPLSPPGIQRGPQRSVAKASALRLITSFEDNNQKSKFLSQADDGRTPLAGTHAEVTTAVLRSSESKRFETPTTARPLGPNFSRERLPSIGETPVDPPASFGKFPSNRGHSRNASGTHDASAAGSALQRAATAAPVMMGERDLRDRAPSPNAEAMTKMRNTASHTRNGSRDRVPLGANLQWNSLNQVEPSELASPGPSATSSSRFHWPSRRRGPGSVASSVTSASSVARSVRHQTSRVRERDNYIHSLDTAAHYSSRKQKSRQASRERSRGRHEGQERAVRPRDDSEERGWNRQKRSSPTSPVSMSPEDLISLSTPKVTELGDPMTRKASDTSAARSASRTSSRAGRSRNRPPALTLSGRSGAKDGPPTRSPSEPPPLTATSQHYAGSEDEADYRAAIEAQEQFRAKHSRSRGLGSPMVNRRDRSASRRPRANSEAADVLAPLTFSAVPRTASSQQAGNSRSIKDQRQQKKEQAARELEERRRSLAMRPQAPSIPHPDHFAPAHRIAVEADDSEPDEIPRCATEPPRSMYARGGPSLGLPATPKAMRLIIDNEKPDSKPQVPPIPFSFSQQQSPQSSPQQSPKSDSNAAGSLLTLLPSTVYQPPARPMLPRSMSAPPPEDVPSKHRRKPSGLDGIPEGGERRRSNEELVPPPPPPPPARHPLEELQHLLVPPPPPPAPLPIAGAAGRNMHGGALGSGMIEIVMDDNEGLSDNESTHDASTSVSGMGYNRRGSGDGSVTSRISRTTERLRSATRTNKETRANGLQFEAPYESIKTMNLQMKSPPPMSQNKHMSTGLHQSEMI